MPVCVLLQALLGPSGAGKSHLLDILAQRKSTGNITGDILLNGQKISSSSYRRKVAYVPQVSGQLEAANLQGTSWCLPHLTTSACVLFSCACCSLVWVLLVCSFKL